MRVSRPTLKPLLPLLTFLAVFGFQALAHAGPGGGPLGGYLMSLVGWAQYVIGVPLMIGGFIFAGVGAITGGARDGIGKAVTVMVFGGIVFKAEEIVGFMRGL